MTLKKKTNKKPGRSLEEDIKRLEESGLIDKSDKKKVKKDKHDVPSTKQQQQTGDTERSDRRL